MESSSADPSPIKARKFRKLGGVAALAILSIESTIAQLKNESASIKSNGIAQYIEDGDAKVSPELKALLLSYLSQKTETVYPDIKGDEYATANSATFDEFKKAHSEFTSDQTGAHHANLGAENCLNLYCNLLNNLKIGTNTSDGNPFVYLEKSSGSAPEKDAKSKMPGGFSTEYRSVATKVYNKAMQDRCLFGFSKATKFANECTSPAATLNAKVLNLMVKLFPDFVPQSEGVHVLFNWNPHSMFTYHTDKNSDVTVIVNLSPAKSSFHIAGMEEEAKYNEPGDAVVLPSAVWHRSGTAERRTVKVAYFFNLMKKEVKKEEPKKEEPKTETLLKDVDVAKAGNGKSIEAASGSADPATTSGEAADQEPPAEEDTETAVPEIEY